MEKCYTEIFGQKDFENFLREYFSSETNKPLVILSKPFSGRTSIVKKVADELGIPRHAIDRRKKSLLNCPSGFEDLDHKQKGIALSFDEWMALNESKYEENLKWLGTEKKEYRYTILELEPDFAFLINDWDLSNYECKIGDIYKSDKYSVVLFVPFFEDWVSWAKQSECIHPKVIEFAEKYSVYYAIEHSIFNRLSHEFTSFLKRVQKDNLAFSRETFESEVVLPYMGFLLHIGKSVTALFWDFIKDMSLDELVAY